MPEMQATLFDFPTVIAVAEAQLRADRLQGRVNLVSGNYLKDALPPGHDLALLSAITHQHPRGK
ncbi:MAG: hypothetical protein HZT40_09190 [Candidatus Thiothrix singaporensis]|uniref:O-methyltransferase C-terminal domain-containing protein n=1 Tax=Candidatus Thiothrix singaporensis TaxID=2799669 RepID=A0A7L6ARY0_9GAMM|nr:MAG: hypothetical protein HZT40_09190 [Candidatus Thiothrix singaporensis]